MPCCFAFVVSDFFGEKNVSRCTEKQARKNLGREHFFVFFLFPKLSSARNDLLIEEINREPFFSLFGPKYASITLPGVLVGASARLR
jgi:hypothetical protein